MNQEKSDATVGQLIGALASDTGALVRQEIRLAATEITETAREAARDVGFVAAGGALLHLGCLALVGALIAALTPYLSLWASAGIIGVVFAGLGLAMVQAGITALRRIDPIPSNTLSTLQPAGFEQGRSTR